MRNHHMAYIISQDIMGTRIKKNIWKSWTVNIRDGGGGMVFNATFNNISVIYKGNWVEMFVKCYGIKLCAKEHAYHLSVDK
jgi:hypothetical protein